MINVYVRQGMVLDKTHEIISFEESKRLENYIHFITQKQNHAVNDFEKDFYKLLKNAVYGKTMEKVLNRCTIDFIKFKRDDFKKIIKQQPKLTFNEFISPMKIVIVIILGKKKM